VRTPFFEQPPEQALEPDDVARSVVWAMTQPRHVDINEILIRPAGQTT
jgi:NADP-dependent 3-hydroxy acid dehydrogenase YdfG